MANQTQIGANGRSEAQHWRRVLQVAKGVSATLGDDFFHSAVSHLADALRADCVYIGERAEAPIARVRTLAVFRDGAPAENFEQSLSGTAAAQAMSDGIFACSKDARRLFPLDSMIEEDRAQAFAGVRLCDSQGQPIGLLALLSRARLSTVPLVRSVLETFAPRAAAELARKRADDIQRENEERYRAFVSTNPDGMWRVEFEQAIPLDLREDEQIDRIYRFGYIAECNDAVAKSFGMETAEKLLGARFAEIAPRTDARVIEELRSAVRSKFRGTTIETSPLDESGRPLYRLRSQFGVVEDGQLRRIWGSTRDITALRRAELALSASQRRFREVLEGVQVPAVMLDVQGALLFCNPSFLRLAQRSREDVSKLAWLEGIISPDEAKTWKAALVADPQGRRASFHFEGAIIPRTGRPHVIAWDTVCLLNQHEELAGMAAIGRNITRERALETEIRQTLKLDSIGRVAAGIAHDFNNLLMIVLGDADQLLRRTEKSDPAYARLTDIQKAAMQCTNLTAHLMTIGRQQQFQPKLIDLNEIITGQESIFRSLVGENTELKFQLASSLPLVNADPTQIQRALMNLVKNAAEAMPQGGKLNISTSYVEVRDDESDDLPAKPGHYVRISVADTGVGLSDEAMAHMFEPFFTTKPPGKGTGLGLSTVYGIVTQSGGQVAVRGEQGKGTTFEILLPADGPPDS
ncbi:MAG TPA: ATP-binding protein [Bryobacteraceae bacterium]|jgi:hypothetical protein